MKKMQLWPLTLLFLIACASTDEKRKVVWESWKGKTAKKLEKHPYFKHLPVQKVKHTSGLETWVFRDQSRFQSDSYCQSIGGCLGMPIYNCDNAFSIKNNIILGYEQNGTCPPVKVIEASKK